MTFEGPGDTPSEPIRIYLDDDTEPFQIAEPPLRFNFSTIHLADGDHTLRVEASNGLAPPTVRTIPFRVRNGVAVTVSGLEPGQTIGGQVELIINAFAGSTEADFEPRQAETPQPVPTWAWVLLLAVGAWSLFYMLNPAQASQAQTAAHARTGPALGAQLYADTCARCHGEDGRGHAQGAGHFEDGNAAMPAAPAPLRDSKNFGVAQHPFHLLSKVVTGKEFTQMPAWGTLMNNDEIVAVVNHVRSSWGHDASQIKLRFRFPPKEIEVLECHIANAILQKDVEQLGAWAFPPPSFVDERTVPILFRNDPNFPKGGEVGREEVLDRWAQYFEDLCDGKVTSFDLLEARYDYEPETVHQEGAYVVAMGNVYQESTTDKGDTVSAKGRFIRVYQRRGGLWVLVFDFADIPFDVGCIPDAQLDGEPLPGEGDEGTDTDAAGGGGAAATDLGYQDVVALLEGLGRSGKTAPHGNFWRSDYQEFVDLMFRHKNVRIRMVVPFYSEKSNLIRGLKKQPLLVCGGGAEPMELSVRAMPPGARPMRDEDVAKIAAWIDAGCPEIAGEPTTQERVPDPNALLCTQHGGVAGGSAQADAATGRKPHPGCASLGAELAAAIERRLPPGNGHGAHQGRGGSDGLGEGAQPSDGGGFPPPGDGGGFPPPGDGGGFPPPGDGGGFPPPADGGGGGFPEPAPPKDPAPPTDAPTGFPPPR